MPSNLTPAQRSQLASAAALDRWAREPDRTAATQAMRDAQQRKLELEVDPNHLLDPADRTQRANRLRRARLQRAAVKSGQARRQRSAARKARENGGAA
jgi:hypothetical protein